MSEKTKFPGQLPESETRLEAPPASGAPEAAAWVQAGIKTLVRETIESVRIDRLAEQLGVPERQFYENFADQDGLHAAVLDRWLYKTTVGIIERAENEGTTPQKKLRRLLELPFWSTKIGLAADLELAIRDWARRSSQTHESVQHADNLRLKYLNTLFESMDFDPMETEIRAHVAYALVRYLTQNCHLGEPVLRRIVQTSMDLHLSTR